MSFIPFSWFFPGVERIGGPGTWLPAPVESFLSWSLAITNLSVSGYYYLMGTARLYLQKHWLKYPQFMIQHLLLRPKSMSQQKQEKQQSYFYLPLTTCSRAETTRCSAQERFQQLVQILRDEGIITIQEDDQEELLLDTSAAPQQQRLIQTIRSDIVLRRLTSLAMRTDQMSDRHGNKSHLNQGFNTSPVNDKHKPLARLLMQLWPQLLELPSPPLPIRPGGSHGSSSQEQQQQQFVFSLIVVCFGEKGSDVQEILQHALDMAGDPSRVQVVLVDAGGKCQDLQAVALTLQNNSSNSDNNSKNKKGNKSWGQLLFVQVEQPEGRGASMNFGARHATGSIYTFLHCDTRLPIGWDDRIYQVLMVQNSNNNRVTTVTACAFSFGIDTSPRTGLRGGPLPPGIRAVEVTANLRSHWWSLPYGDQCLSLPATIFDYLGGFPHQCIMEDYELVLLLRQRVAASSRLALSSSSSSRKKEQLQILPGPPVQCSPRRWQRYGVLFVTHRNSRLVQRYSQGESPESIYQSYYHNNNKSEPPSLPMTPWELKLQERLQTKAKKAQ